MRKALKIVLGLLVLVVIVALSAPLWLDVNRYHDRIQSELQKKLGRPVSLGKMHLKLLPFSFSADNVLVGEDARFGNQRSFAQAQQVYITAPLVPLLHGDVQLQSLELVNPKIELVRDAQGTWNFSSIAKGQPAPGPTAPNPAPQSQQSGGLTLEDLKITDGQVAITDLQKRTPRAVYDHIDLRLVGYRPDKPFDFALAAHLPGQGTQVMKLDGKAGPINANDSLRTPFNGTVELQQVTLASLSQFLNSQALAGTNGIATGKADVKNENGKVSANGSLKLDDAVIKGHALGFPIAADIDLTDDLNSDQLQVRKGNLKLGATPLAIAGSMNLRPTPAQIDMRLKADNVSIEEAARLAAALGVAFNPNTKIAGKLDADIRAQGSTSSPVLTGNLAGQDLVMSGKDLVQPVSVKAIQLALSPTTITSNEFTASTGGTSVAVKFALAQYASPNPSVDATIRTGNAKLDELLSIAKAYGVSAVDGVNGTGLAALDVHAVGPLKNTAAMNLSGSGKLANASLSVPSLRKPLLVKNADISFTRNSAVLQNVAATLGSTNASGALTASNLDAPQVQFTLNADTVDLVELQQIIVMQPAGNSSGNATTGSRFALVPSANAAAPGEPGIITKTTGTGTITVGLVKNDQLVLTNARSAVTLDHGIIKLEPITAQMYGGQETGNIVLDMRTTPSRYSVNTKLTGVDANKLLSSVSNLKTVFGLLATNAEAGFSSQAGAGSSEIARSLNGKASLNLLNGKIIHMDVLSELSKMGQFVGFKAPHKDYTNISKLAGDVNINNGVAQTNNLTADIDEGTLAMNGTANLADQTLNMHVVAVLNKTFSDSVGGSKIGGFATTALANRNGELVLPVILTGSFQSPKFNPDYATLAKMKLDNLVPTLTNPGQMGGILGSILGGNKQGQTSGTNGKQPGQTQQSGNAMKDILGAIQGKQPQQQNQTQGQPAGTQPNGTQPNGTQNGQAQPPANQNGQPAQQGNPQTGQQQKPSWQDIVTGALGKKQPPPAQPTQSNGANGQPQNPSPKPATDYSDAPPAQPK